jgi:hypothetical protein
MMMSEFIERTGFQPTYDEYEQIQDAYYLFDGGKDEFCKKFVAENGEKKVYQARAEEIERLRSQMLELDKHFKQELDDREQKPKSLSLMSAASPLTRL